MWAVDYYYYLKLLYVMQISQTKSTKVYESIKQVKHFYWVGSVQVILALNQLYGIDYIILHGINHLPSLITTHMPDNMAPLIILCRNMIID